MIPHLSDPPAVRQVTRDEARGGRIAMDSLLDTANVNETREAWDTRVISGVTTDPTFIAREGRIFEDVGRDTRSQTRASRDS